MIVHLPLIPPSTTPKQAEHSAHPEAACSTVTGTRYTDRKVFPRRQRQEQFRAALAFALALDRLAAEGRRRAPLDAPCANDARVPQYTTAQFENPLMPEVRLVGRAI